MRLRILVWSLAPLVTASLAHAQAPGEPVAPVVVAPVVAQPVVVAPVFAQPVIAAPGMTPVMAPAMAPAECAAPPVRESVMENRWSLGLSVGSMAIAPKDFPDDHTAFVVGELAFRFRVTPHFELEASAGGGRERTSDGMDGDLEVTTAMIAARWRFMPESRWNWFVTGGLGGAAITLHDATDQQRKDATQPMGMLGVGVERRFAHLALQAELRAFGMGKAKDSSSDAPAAEMAVTVDPGPRSADIQRNGGSLTAGLSYYF